MRARPLALLGALTSLLGCDLPSAPFRWESEHFIYRSDSVPVLTESQQIEEFEHHLTSVTGAMGIDIAPGDQIEFRQIDVSRWSASYDGYYTPDYDVVISQSEFHGHELIHAYASRVARVVPSYLSEGLAVALSTAPYRLGSTVPDPEVVEWLQTSDTSAGGDVTEAVRRYDVSGAFVGFLIARHGLPTFMQAYGNLAGRQDVDAVFRDRFGEGLDALVSAWVAEGPRETTSRASWIPECTAGEVEAPDQVRELTFETRHYLTGAVTPPGLPFLAVPPPGGAEEIHVVDLPAGRQVWESQSESMLDVDAIFLPCASGPLPRRLRIRPGSQRTWLDLPGGPTAVFFAAKDPAHVSLSIQPTPSVGSSFADACGGDVIEVDATPMAAPRYEILRFTRADGESCMAGCDLFTRVRTDQSVVAFPVVVYSQATVDGDGRVESVCDETCGNCTAPSTDPLQLQPGTHWLKLHVATPLLDEPTVDVGFAFRAM